MQLMYFDIQLIEFDIQVCKFKELYYKYFWSI